MRTASEAYFTPSPPDTAPPLAFAEKAPAITSFGRHRSLGHLERPGNQPAMADVASVGGEAAILLAAREPEGHDSAFGLA